MPIKIVVMVRRRPGLSPEEFRQGYEESHSRIAVGLFGDLWVAYRRNYLINGRTFEEGVVRRPGGPEGVGFDAISEYILRDAAAQEEMSRIARENWDLIKEDEALWFDQENCWSFTCETMEEDLGEPRPVPRRWAERTA